MSVPLAALALFASSCAALPGAGPAAERDADLARLRRAIESVRAEVSACEERARMLEPGEEPAAPGDPLAAAVEGAAARLREAGLDARAKRNAVAIVLPADSLFERGGAELAEEGAKLLTSLAGLLRADAALAGAAVDVEGHTDSVRPSGARLATNWELSMARAVAVARFLVERGGVEGRRVRAAAFAETRPVEANVTAEGRAANRRVEVVVRPVAPQTGAGSSGGGGGGP